MKNSIKLAALFMLATTGVFAATPAKTNDKVQDEINVQASDKELVVGVSILKESTGRTYVKFYDNEANEVMTDYLPSNKSAVRGYNLAELPYGTYTMAVTSNKQVVTRQLHVYKEAGKKTYVFLQ